MTHIQWGSPQNRTEGMQLPKLFNLKNMIRQLTAPKNIIAFDSGLYD
jgi:hypothetical protein